MNMTLGDVWKAWVEVNAESAANDWLSNWRDLAGYRGELVPEAKQDLEAAQDRLIAKLLEHGDQTVVAMICYALNGQQDGDDCMAEFVAHMQRAVMAKMETES